MVKATCKHPLLLSFVVAAVMAVGLLLVAAPPAQAQVAAEPPIIDKECSPNPVQVGQPLTCTIDLEVSPETVVAIVEEVTDTFPTGVRPTSATLTQFVVGTPVFEEPCEVTGNTVTCPFAVLSGVVATARVTIEATAEQCGTFANTARAEGIALIPTDIPFAVEDTEAITVEGCEEAPQQAPAPITQETEQESESGEIEQTFDIS